MSLANGGHEAATKSPTVAAAQTTVVYRTVDQYRLFHSKFIFSRAFQLIQDLKNETSRPKCEACLEKAGLTKARSFNLKTKRAGIWCHKEARLALHWRMSTTRCCHVILDWGPIINRFNTGSPSSS